MNNTKPQDITTKYKIAFNLHYKGKLPEFDIDQWRDFNGKFQNFYLFPDDIMKLITGGHAYTTHHIGYRKRDNFVCGQHLSLDFDTEDTRSTFTGILQDNFIRSHAYALYTTPSHSPSAPRARVLFLLDRPIDSREQYSELAQSLVHRYESVDGKCKDPVRIFFGNENAEVEMLGNVLPLSVAQTKLVTPYRIYKRAHETKPQSFNIIPPEQANGEFSSIKNRLIERILTCPDGEKHATICTVGYTLGGYVQSGYISESDAVTEMEWAIEQRKSVRSIEAAKRTIRTMIKNGMAQPLHLEERYRQPKTFAEAGIVL